MIGTQTKTNPGGLAKVTAGALDSPLGKGTVMSNDTFTIGTRVVVTGETHYGATGTVTAITVTDFLPISVQLDNGRRAVYAQGELDVIPQAPAGFTPVHDMDGASITHYDGPQVEGDGWLLDVLFAIEPGKAGIRIWPVVEGNDPHLSPPQAIEMGRALIATAERYTNVPDYAALEAASLGDPAAEPAGGDL